MTGRLVLAGSGEFTPAMRELDYALLGDLGKRARVAIVPTAAGAEDTPAYWVELGMKHFRALDAEAFPVMVLDRADAIDPRNAAQVAGADWIYFSGGDPGYVVEALEGTPFLDAVMARWRDGAIVAGSSAGAMMMGEKTFVPRDRDSVTGLPKDVMVCDALRLVPGIFIFPHFDAIPREVVHRWEAIWPAGLRLLAIDEDTAVVSNDEGGWNVHGAGRALVMRAPTDQRTYIDGMAIDSRVLPFVPRPH